MSMLIDRHPPKPHRQFDGKVNSHPTTCRLKLCAIALRVVYESNYARNTIWTKELYSPYNAAGDNVLLDAAIGGGLKSVSQADIWVPRNRPFLDMIGRDTLAQDQSPVVRFHFNANPPNPETGLPDPRLNLQLPGWVRYMGQLKILPDRAVILLQDDNLLTSPSFLLDPNNTGSLSMIEAYIKGTFAVSVTCTIEGNQRMVHVGVGNTSAIIRHRYKVLDVANRFLSLNRRGQNSHLNVQDNDAAGFEDRDDLAGLAQYSDRHADQMGRETVSGPIRVPWIDNEWNLGDSFSGSQGMGLPFTLFPQIVSRVYSFDPNAGSFTTYHLSDLRHTPGIEI